MTDAEPEELEEFVGRGEGLYRRLTRYVVKNGKVTRGAYYFDGEPDPSVSVDLASLTTADEARRRAPKPESTGIGELLSDVPLDLGLEVKRDPDLRTGNRAHCLIIGVTTKDLCQQLAEKTRIVIPPPNG